MWPSRGAGALPCGRLVRAADASRRVLLGRACARATRRSPRRRAAADHGVVARRRPSTSDAHHDDDDHDRHAAARSWPARADDGVAPASCVIAERRRAAGRRVDRRRHLRGRRRRASNQAHGRPARRSPAPTSCSTRATAATSPARSDRPALVEKDVNLAVAQDVQAAARGQGATVVLTRTARLPHDASQTRAEIASPCTRRCSCRSTTTPSPTARPTSRATRPTTRSPAPDSKRLAGLLWEEITQRVRAVPRRVGRPTPTTARSTGRTRAAATTTASCARRPGVPTVLSEAAFITNPPEEQLLADPAFQHVEAQAIADAHRPLRRRPPTPAAASSTPYPGPSRPGGGGGPEGCTDPPLA